eukprot:Phypoly_transcript_13744.p1 GENE.Phypoly_transcript_13744~~Phypoly_transcript_13744.p1  ORF type:complete len:332 (+),score=74.65 Phypoly_transcript_13744:21-1016(+)
MTHKVFLSGASGYVAAHVLKQLLGKGYSVRASVRSQQKADQIAQKYPQYKDKLEFVLVEDISKDGAFDGKLEGVEGIFHTASPFHFKVTTSNKVDLVDPAVKGTVGMLESALKVPTVKRVVITSSFAAISDSTKDSSHVYTEADWNPITQEQAENGDARAGYVGSKKLAEKAAHDFIQAKKPHFDIVTINPPLIYGPIEHHINKLTDLNESVRTFYEFVSGQKEISVSHLDVFVDVRDVATAHILAYEKGEPNNRYFIVGGNFSWQEVVDIAHKYFPDSKAKKGNPGDYPPIKFRFDNSKSRTKLGLVYHTKEETFKDAIAQLIEFEKQGL